MATNNLQTVDTVEIQVIVNDEVDFISPSPNPMVVQPGRMMAVPLSPLAHDEPRGDAKLEFKMSNLCCGALGISLLIVSSLAVRLSSPAMLKVSRPSPKASRST